MNQSVGKQAGMWALGLTGSVAAHVGILAILMVAVRPEPVAEQPLPTSKLEVQAYQLDRTQALEQQPDNQRADADTPDGQPLDAGAIPRSRARTQRPKAEALHAGTTRAPSANEITETVPVIAQAAPETTKVSSSLAQSDPVSAAETKPETAPKITPTAARVKAIQQPQPRLEAARIPAAGLVAASAPIASAIPVAVRAELVKAVAQQAVSVVPSSNPTAHIVKVALPVIAAAQVVRPLSNAVPVTDPIVAVLPPGAALTKALPATPPPVAEIQSKPAQGDIVTTSLPEPAELPAAKPEPAVLPQATPETKDIAPGLPNIVTAAAQKTDAAFIPPATPSARKLKAALAFSRGDGDVDPVSIAAFQSFMQPGDITTSGDQLRDGVTGLLAQVPCSRMQVTFDPDTATLQVNGHIPDDDLRAPVLAALQAQMGANITVSDNILILPRPQCGALSGIAGVGLPQSTDQNTNPLVIGADAHARVFSFAKGDLLSLDMTAPDYDAYIYLDYFDADGLVLHLEPNEYAPLRRTDAQAAQRIGAKSMQDTGLKLMIGPPYGQEIAVAFAASEPLYQGLRPIQEPAAQYLEWLKQQVQKAKKDNPDFKGEWVYFFVSTSER